MDHLRTRAFINGEFTDALDGATFDSLSPATGQVVARVAACGDGDVDRAVRAARAAFNSGSWSRENDPLVRRGDRQGLREGLPHRAR
jgi:gamma-glutamyl-gamma-aminobutyraldehyde dehydrogenase